MTAGRGRTAAVLVGLVALGLAAVFVPWQPWVTTLVEVARAAGWPGAVGFAVVYALATAALVPGSWLTLGAGLAWGPLVGFAVVWPGAVLGACLSFGLARTALRAPVEAWVRRHARFDAVDRAVSARGGTLALLLRLSPVFPFNFLNWALGVTRLDAWTYAWTTAVGIVPGTFLYVYAGSTLSSLAELGAGRPDTGLAGQALYWGGLALTVIVTVAVTRAARRALDEVGAG